MNCLRIVTIGTADEVTSLETAESQLERYQEIMIEGSQTAASGPTINTSCLLKKMNYIVNSLLVLYTQKNLGFSSCYLKPQYSDLEFCHLFVHLHLTNGLLQYGSASPLSSSPQSPSSPSSTGPLSFPEHNNYYISQAQANALQQHFEQFSMVSNLQLNSRSIYYAVWIVQGVTQQCW